MNDLRPETLLWTLVCGYMTAKEKIIDCGYAHEIDWQENLSFCRLTESEFLREAAWVILSSGMREVIIRRTFADVSRAFCEWESARRIVDRRDVCRKSALARFNSPRKIDSIIHIAAHVVDRGFDNVCQAVLNDGVDYIAQFPFMGPATSYHFAKNIGLSVAKPDRHLSRIAESVGYRSVHSMCRDIAQLIGDKISVVDVVLWRYATLDKNYLQLFSEAGLRNASRGDYGFCWLDRGESDAIT
ncbi:MAG: hypothetical protein M3R69_17095 [Acidobacteriota bacterium]|nr:hypothetical protein [Acidobacteriota bacterium]